jgi:pimeloyl-ACP methyl ester carboxylesterase
MNRLPLYAVCLLALQVPARAQTSEVQVMVGTVNPKVVCSSNPPENYALYLPAHFSTNREWPIIYVFDPLARGEAAAEVVRPAAEKFGYIVAASNNSKNGSEGGSREAAIAMWDDTQQRLPVDPRRRYVAGMSGGSRVAASVALSCGDCVAGVIANAAAFPPGAVPPHPMKFAYFAAVGDADFNYREFVRLRRQLDRAEARYRIRVFEGPHGWAPPEVWLEALNWMDIQAMASVTLTRDSARITASLQETLARAQAFESANQPLMAFREYESAIRDFSGLADVGAAKAKLAEFEKSKAVKAAEKREAADVEEQERIVKNLSVQMQKLATGDLDANGFSELLTSISTLKRKAEPATRENLVLRRAQIELAMYAYESGQSCLTKKDYDTALSFFRLAATGARKPGAAHYQRARIYAIQSDKKEMLAELRLALSGGYHEPAALDGDEFRPYRVDPEFEKIIAEWKK